MKTGNLQAVNIFVSYSWTFFLANNADPASAANNKTEINSNGNKYLPSIRKPICSTVEEPSKPSE